MVSPGPLDIRYLADSCRRYPANQPFVLTPIALLAWQTRISAWLCLSPDCQSPRLSPPFIGDRTTKRNFDATTWPTSRKGRRHLSTNPCPGSLTQKGPNKWGLSGVWSGKPGSNWRPQPWQGCALPTELFPRRGEILASDRFKSRRNYGFSNLRRPDH